MNKQEVKNFFKEIHQGEYTNFRCIKSGNKSIDCSGVFNENTEPILSQANEQSFEIYFVVNSGGYRDKDIGKFNAVFIDLDCGRDENGDYFSKAKVNDFKYNKWIEIQEFDLSPSYIVETRNGYHVYWLLHEGVSKEEFMLCERGLIEKFDADKAVKNPARLMRVPEFFWCKDKNKKFLVRIIQHNNKRYRIEDLQYKLPKVKEA